MKKRKKRKKKREEEEEGEEYKYMNCISSKAHVWLRPEGPGLNAMYH